MKTLFKTALAVSLLLCLMQMQAQVQFGVKVGLNGNNISQNLQDHEEIPTRTRVGYHLGATVDYSLSNALSLQSGLLYSSKGFSFDMEADADNGVSVKGYNRAILNYLEIPMHVTYKMNKFQMYAGPYVAIGVGGKNKWDYTYQFDNFKTSEKGETRLKPVFGKVGVNDLDGEEEAFRAVDYGINAGVGYRAGSILVNAGYGLGLGKLPPKYKGDEGDAENYKISNRVLTVSMSYFFGG